MKERPILFSAPMVRALLAGRKTQTRRIITPLPSWKPHSVCKPDGAADPWSVWFHYPETDRVGHIRKCPHGQPGDRLWVKEGLRYDDVLGMHYAADKTPLKVPDDVTFTVTRSYCTSMFMSRWASRLTRDVTEVRAQRLLDISEEDAIAEGLSCVTKDGSLYKYGIPDRDGLPGTDDDGWPWIEWDIDPRIAYFKLWNKINGAGAASKNPWVWAVTMKEVA